MFFQKAWSGMNLAGTSLVGQWLGLHASTAGNGSSIPWSGTKILQAAWHGQKTKKKNDYSSAIYNNPKLEVNRMPSKSGRGDVRSAHPIRQSVQFSRSLVSDSLWPHGLQHARPPCPSPTPGVHPNPCPLSR